MCNFRAYVGNAGGKLWVESERKKAVVQPLLYYSLYSKKLKETTVNTNITAAFEN
jgi:hypothetical protein